MNKIPYGLAPAAYIPAMLFGAISRARNSFYETGIFRARRLPAPVISIGNITMGGSGKTPMVIHIARILLRLGLKPAILTRGYGRKDPGKTIILSGKESNTPAEIGDEPFLMRRHVPSLLMGISRFRFEAGVEICSKFPDSVFILDDGFQHRKLFRDLDILILDRSQPLASNQLFPLGNLRERLSSLLRADIIVINGGSKFSDAHPIDDQARSINSQARFFICRQKISSLIPFRSWVEMHKNGEVSPDAFYNAAFLVSAIGNPDRFSRDIQQCGIKIRGTRFFRDHHWLTLNDWNNCIKSAKSVNAEAIIMTEKDAVKVSETPDFPILVAVQSTEMTDESEFERLIEMRVKELPLCASQI